MDIKQSFHKLFFVIFLLCIDTGLSIIPDEDYFDEPSFNRCPWIRNKLKNGRVRYRYKGRVAKFLCDSGFELAGKRSSTCVRGQWSNPVPVCVARGCPRVPSISNGRITEMYRGALLVYDCNPGYVLDGNPTIHCDGRRWNTSPPLCAIATEKPETYCDFENPDLCGWSHDPTHDFDWTRNQFSTPSGHVGTGPAFDHTFGENKAGFYLYIEASSPRKINDTARLFSPVYPQDLSGGCFIFWYHMYGATTGGLRVYLKPESHVFDELKPNWEKHGDQGNQWLKGHMIVPVLHENFQIVIEGVRGESYVGDSAIDDVRLTTNLCDSDDNSTDITENVDQYSCRGRCQESGSESSCGCNANCVDEPNFCCRDYYTICTAGNSTAVQNTDEPLPEDFTTTSSSSSQSTTASKLQHSDEPYNSTTLLQTEKQESTNYTTVNSSNSFTSTPVSVYFNTSTKSNILPTTEKNIQNISSETSTSMKITGFPNTVSSEVIKTESSTSTTVTKTTKYISTDSSTPVTSTTITSSQTTVRSTTPQTIPTTVPTTTVPTTTVPTTTVPTTEKTTTSEIPETTVLTTTTITSTTTTTPKTTTQNLPVSETALNFTSSVKKTSSLATHSYTSSTSAATITNRASATMSTTLTTLLSTRKTYNLRPRNRTTTTIEYTTQPITNRTEVVSSTSTTSKVSMPDYSVTTTPHYLTSWYRYSVSPSSKQQSSTSSTERITTYIQKTSTKSIFISETETLNVLKTTRIPRRFTKPTESSLPKHSEFYESKSKTSSSNSSVPVIVSIVIAVIICLVAGAAYYMRKQRSKRQSKLSDDSEMRFLPESDYMEYSDSSALDRILNK